MECVIHKIIFWIKVTVQIISKFFWYKKSINSLIVYRRFISRLAINVRRFLIFFQEKRIVFLFFYFYQEKVENFGPKKGYFRELKISFSMRETQCRAWREPEGESLSRMSCACHNYHPATKNPPREGGKKLFLNESVLCKKTIQASIVREF